MPLDHSFFLISHDYQGKPRLHSRATAIGLAACVLAELILSEHITIGDDKLVVVAQPSGRVANLERLNGGVPQHAPPADPVAHSIWDQIRHESQPHHIRTWFGALAPTISTAVGTQMARTNLVSAVESGLMRKVTRFVPVEVNAGAKVLALLEARLIAEDPKLSWPDAVLSGIIKAAGLLPDLLGRDHSGKGGRYLQHVLKTIDAQMPPFTHLFVDLEVAIGAAVLAHRT